MLSLLARIFRAFAVRINRALLYIGKDVGLILVSGENVDEANIISCVGMNIIVINHRLPNLRMIK